MQRRSDPIGVILAGGLGRRIGGSKAVVALRGRPLISYPLEVLRAALGEVAVIAKPDTELPPMAGVSVWIEPPTPRHPLVGLRHALGLADGRPVLVCAADMPFVTVEVVRGLAQASHRAAPAVIACCGGSVQPLLGCYQPRALPLLGREVDVPLQEAVAAIGPALFEVPAEVLFNVNAPEELLHAAALLDRAPRGGSTTRM